MVARDCRPRHPPDGTVCADRRSRDPLWPGPAGLGHLVPYLPEQPGYHKRLKAAGPLLAAVMDHLARVYARITQRLLAMAAAIWHNWRTGADAKRSLIDYDH